MFWRPRFDLEKPSVLDYRNPDTHVLDVYGFNEALIAYLDQKADYHGRMSRWYRNLSNVFFVIAVFGFGYLIASIIWELVM